jgi:chromosome partitioning protein
MDIGMATAATYVEKGGVGKTTSAAHIGVSAAQHHNLDVLLVGLAGTQNDLVSQFGLRDQREDVKPVSAVFGDEWSEIRGLVDDPIDMMTLPTGEGPDLIPADTGLSGKDNNLANVPREERFHRFAEFLREDAAGQYDLAILDLPGKEDNIALSGLFAAEHVIAPIKPGEFEKNQLNDLQRQIETISGEFAKLPQDQPPRVRLALTFATMVSEQHNVDSEFLEYLETEYAGVVGEPVPSSKNIVNEQTNGQTLFAVPDDELYGTGKRAREAYRALTSDLLERIQ